MPNPLQPGLSRERSAATIHAKGEGDLVGRPAAGSPFPDPDARRCLRPPAGPVPGRGGLADSQMTAKPVDIGGHRWTPLDSGDGYRGVAGGRGWTVAGMGLLTRGSRVYSQAALAPPDGPPGIPGTYVGPCRSARACGVSGRPHSDPVVALCRDPVRQLVCADRCPPDTVERSRFVKSSSGRGARAWLGEAARRAVLRCNSVTQPADLDRC
jgi:hypothetical protein